jgi:hypothetical protein
MSAARPHHHADVRSILPRSDQRLAVSDQQSAVSDQQSAISNQLFAVADADITGRVHGLRPSKFGNELIKREKLVADG